jgi:glucosamine-6-phosphate deaminase
LHNTINAILANFRDSFDGQKNPPKVQKLKGMILEFE